MEKAKLRGRILKDLENLISRTCAKGKMTKRVQQIHSSIIKNHYNATDVYIDYHRKRVVMEILLDDSNYDPKTINLSMPTFNANFIFTSLCDFLKSCMDEDHKSLAYYSGLLSSYKSESTQRVFA
ncbi:hypothetical protein [Eudoraea chungangensis]|uniref:hypothetical protein n=1 Tax=Eudoraea chungangensis TaxID=1481905 RepID=UPI0023EB3E15|nr:hypothetical protein [Eudoraea chungangensis]